MAPSGGRSAERRLLAACLQVGRSGRGLATLASADLDWTALLELATPQFLAPTVWQALLEEDAAEAIPPAVRASLEEEHQGASAANALLLHDLARVQALLEGAGLPSVALKGSALCLAHYPSVGARHVGDIDLLVRPADLEAAAAVLRGAGLRRPVGLLPSLDGSSGADAVRAPWAHHLPPIATWGGVSLELHDRTPGGGPPPEEILARRRSIDRQGLRVHIPSPVDLAGVACLHTLLHHRFVWRARARLVADLEALLATGPLDWDEVRARYGVGDGGSAVEEARALLEAARREAAGEGRSPRRLCLLEPPGAGRGLVDGLGSLREALERARRWGGLASAVRVVFPARRFMEARFGLRPGSPRVWLMYPWRLVRGALRALLGGQS